MFKLKFLIRDPQMHKGLKPWKKFKKTPPPPIFKSEAAATEA